MFHNIFVITMAVLISVHTLGAIIMTIYMLFMVTTGEIPDADTGDFIVPLDEAIEKGEEKIMLHTITTFPWTHVIAQLPSDNDYFQSPEENTKKNAYWTLRFFPPENTPKTRIITVRMKIEDYGDAGLNPNLPESWRAEQDNAGFIVHKKNPCQRVINNIEDTEDEKGECVSIWLSEGFTVIRDNNE